MQSVSTAPGCAYICISQQYILALVSYMPDAESAQIVETDLYHHAVISWLPLSH